MDGADAARDGLRAQLAQAGPRERTHLLLAAIEAHGQLRLPGGDPLPLDGVALDADTLRSLAAGREVPWWRDDAPFFAEADLAGARLQGADLRRADLRRADLRGASLRGADLRGARLEEARLDEADLAGADLTGVQAGEANFTDALLEDARFAGAALRFAVFRGALLDGADFAGADLWAARMEGAEATGTGLRGAQLSEAELARADLSGADLEGATLQKATLRGTKLRGAKLDGASLSGADLDAADLTDAGLPRVNLSSCNLRHARLSGAWLEKTWLRQDQLGGALGEEASGEWEAARQGYLNLEQNFRSIGNPEAASWAYRRARRMGKLHARHLAALSLRHRDWRGAVPRLLAAASDAFVEWLCDYGEGLARVVRAYALAVLLFALFYGLTGSLVDADGHPTRNPVLLLAYSWLSMTTSGQPNIGLTAAGGYMLFLDSLQYTLGVVLTGLFGFVLGNRIRR